MEKVGILKHLASGKLLPLPLHAVAGRAPSCSIRLGDPAASNDHASLAWVDEGWEVRDLGSTNGTRVDGRRVEPGTKVRIGEGAEIVFGAGAETWVLTEASEPTAVARSLESGEMLRAIDGFLELPGPESETVAVLRDEEERWQIEGAAGSRRPAVDGEHVIAGGSTWVLALPPASPLVGTRRASPGLSLATVKLRFHVSGDEEHIRVDLVHEPRIVSLKERAAFYLLLHLARARGSDQAAGVPDGEQGWLDVDLVVNDLKIKTNHLNVMTLRLRRSFAAAGVSDAEGIVERRAQQVRIGAARLEVVGAKP
jgi:hypothetical protein